MHVVAIKIIYAFGLGSIARCHGSGRRSKITPDVLGIVHGGPDETG